MLLFQRPLLLLHKLLSVWVQELTTNCRLFGGYGYVKLLVLPYEE